MSDRPKYIVIPADVWNATGEECMKWFAEKITITTKAEAEALLSTYTVEQVRQLWENSAFASPLPTEVKEYFIQLLLNPPKTD